MASELQATCIKYTTSYGANAVVQVELNMMLSSGKSHSTWP